jgi:hypothetical protein
MEIELTRDTWWIALVVFGAVLVPTIYKAVRNRGLRGAMFGAPLLQKIGELELSRGGLTKTKLRVHALDPRDRVDGPHVGIEVVRSTFASWEMSPVSLTRSEARQLADELSRAIETSERAG